MSTRLLRVEDVGAGEVAQRIHLAMRVALVLSHRSTMTTICDVSQNARRSLVQEILRPLLVLYR